MDVILATASYDHTIRFWEALSGICVQTLQLSESHINRLAISNDKKYLAVAGNPSLKLYDVQSRSNTPVSQFDGHTGNITAVKFQANNRWIMTASEDGSIKIWDIRAPNVQREYKLGCPVNDAIIHPNQGEIISGDQSGGVRIWDLAENQCTLQMYPEDAVPIRSVTISPDARFICAGNNSGRVYVWCTQASANTEEGEAADGGGEGLNADAAGVNAGGEGWNADAAGINAGGEDFNADLGESKGEKKRHVNDIRAWQKIQAHSKLLATCSADCTVKVWKDEGGLNVDLEY